MSAEEVGTTLRHRATTKVEMVAVVSTPPELLSSLEFWWWGSVSAVP
jgi:hypothetical protein